VSQPSAEKEEFLDILDESGQVIGQELRSKCHSDPNLRHRAVHVFVRNRKGEIFLQKRSLAKKIQPGKWDTSVGGHLAVGESYEEAAARELEEELGVRLQELGSVSELRKRHDYVWQSPVETEHIRTYEVHWDGPFRLQEDEIDEGKFWTEAELRQTIGKGILTPNLEEELRLLGIYDPRQQEAI
jgi:isopentenyl-diphosphate delta-isomerase type 1